MKYINLELPAERNEEIVEKRNIHGIAKVDVLLF